MSVRSSMLPLGTPAPNFALPDVSTGKRVQLSDFAESRALLVVFLCVDCPYVVHVRPELVRLEADYSVKGVAIVGISSNDVDNSPADAPMHLAAMARAAGIKFPILYDQSQKVAKAFTAACTPDFFLFDGRQKLAYCGQLDPSRPSRGAGKSAQGALDGTDVRMALDAILAGWPINKKQSSCIGSSIKWKPGNEPGYLTK